ncbi:hypothetical protein F441_00697, partial [Phytophthora nicotianae CJ01A1]
FCQNKLRPLCKTSSCKRGVMEAGQGEASPPVPPAEGTQHSPSSDEESASEYVDSSDSNWSGGSVVDSITLDDDYETQESCEAVEVSEDDLSVYLVNESIAAKARRLVREDSCDSKCLEGLESDVERLLVFFFYAHGEVRACNQSPYGIAVLQR